MRFRQMATYRGMPYEVGVGPSESDVVLLAASPPPGGLGFEPAGGYWRKRVIRAEVDVLWVSRPVGTFHGEPCLVLDDLGDRLHIAYLGKDGRRARDMGFWPVDRGVFELLTPRGEVSGLIEQKVEKALPRPAAGAQAPPVPSYPYSGQPADPAPAAASTAPQARVGNGRAGYRSEPALAPAGARSDHGDQGGPGGWPVGARPEPATDYGAGRPVATPSQNGHQADGLPAVAGSGWAGASGTGTGRHGADGWVGGGPRQPAGRNGHAAAGLASWDSMAAAVAPMPAGSPAGDPGTGFGVTHNGASRAGAGARHRQAGRSARKQRVPTRSIFCELADLAAIPRSAYSLEQESDGAMCLLRTRDGFEVFTAADGARHEVRAFGDEEAAYFYLFGVLAAEAVRNGALARRR
jgi:hypothetical protein